MQISREWLGAFIQWTEEDPQGIADRLTAATGEVDDVIIQGRLLDKCVVGRIVAISKHPNADKLSLVDVETDQGTKRVVCGGTNLKEHQLVAFAHVGATVKWHGSETVTLKPAKIRGEMSEGMICAAEELELESLFSPAKEAGAHPIADLTSMALAVGTPLKDALKLDDVIFHIDNHAITNRPDLFSHVGIARECVALGLATWKKKAKTTLPKFPSAALPFRCINDVPTLIPRYEACLIEIDAIGTTPDWMKRRLEATGWRPISLPIDITNYVMMETGMPLHSFDADDFRGDMHMRAAKEGEKLTTLDGIERALPEGAIVISDDDGIFDLLGIMGGLRSSTKDTTKHIYLHAAQVDGARIRKTIIATGHRTDAATTYEKGVAAITVERGFARALELILELVPGAKIISRKESHGKNPESKPISLSMDRLQSMLGAEIAMKEIMQILEDLECGVTKAGKKLRVVPPLHRLADLTGAHELIEEIARIYGYDNIAPAMPVADVRTPEIDDRVHQLRAALKERGYYELLHLAFTSPQMLQACAYDSAQTVRIENPLGDELSLMRPSLLPSMLKTVGREVRREGRTMKFFEVGHIFTATAEAAQLCLAVSSREDPHVRDEPLLQLKDDLHEALATLGYDCAVAQRTDALPAFAHPGRSADVRIGQTVVGLLTEIHPITEEKMGLADRTAVALLDWDAILALPRSAENFQPLPAFPSVCYDETLPLAFTGSYAQAIAAVRSLDPLLVSVEPVDLYQKDADRRITLRFTYRSPDRTLEQKETDGAHQKIMNALKSPLAKQS